MFKRITTRGGIKLKTAGTQVTEDIIVMPNLQSKLVTHNGSVVPDQGYCGLSEVTVNLPFITVENVSTVEDLEDMLESKNFGKVYRFVGSDQDGYKHNCLYQIIADEDCEFLLNETLKYPSGTVGIFGFECPEMGERYLGMRFIGNASSFLVNYEDGTPEQLVMYDSTNGWADEDYRKILIYEKPSSDDQIWLMKNSLMTDNEENTVIFEELGTNLATPIEVSTASDMDALLTIENIGKAYRYTGTTTADYVQGDIYIVEES